MKKSKKVKKIMIEKYCIKELGYDFMGYQFDTLGELSYHHLIIPRRLCKEQGLGKGYFEWNGAILNKDTAHTYLHLIESIDYDMFIAISSEMLDEKIKGFLDMQNIEKIDDILNCFEREYSGRTTYSGNPVIKEKYTRRLLKK